MRHTVTHIELRYWDGVRTEETLVRLNGHVSEMSRDGWRVVSTVQADPTHPLAIFWQAD